MIVTYYDWANVRGSYSNGSVLPGAIEDLCSATVRENAELAVRRIEQVCPADSELSDASVALASCLVHATWSRSEISLDLILGLLDDMATGQGEVRGDDEYLDVRAKFLREVCRGFPIYVELLETHPDHDVRTACIDLISICGLFDKSLTERAAWVLGAAKKLERMEEFHSLIDASIDDLR